MQFRENAPLHRFRAIHHTKNTFLAHFFWFCKYLNLLILKIAAFCWKKAFDDGFCRLTVRKAVNLKFSRSNPFT